MILNREQVSELIPQKKPFVMVHGLLLAEELELKSNFLIEEENILCENGEFSSEGLIENIAQTCAAGFGYQAKVKGEQPKVGFIGSISKLIHHNNPNIGDVITTNIKVVTTFENVTLIKGENFLGDKKLVECEMKIVITD
jgi:hypothetical protein